MWYKDQRILSENEKNLGLGSVQSFDINNKTLKIDFPLVGEVRTYALRSASIKRFFLKVGQTVKIQNENYTVQNITFEENFAKYHCESGKILWEYELTPNLTEEFSVLEKIINEPLSPFRAYDLRREALKLCKNLSQDRLSGLITSRVNLLPHQIYLANEISGEENPRVLLADEVGLGKTIEAGLIYSCLKGLEKAERVLIITPKSLVHQWAQELAQSFNSLFSVFDETRYKEEKKSLGESPFETNPQVIISLESLMEDPQKMEEVTNCKWDLLIVDEAHHLEWDPDSPSKAWHLVDKISTNSKSLLLLTATPRQRGLATQYGLLHMIDPKKFCNFEDFAIEMELLDEVALCAKEISETKSISPKTKKQLSLLFEGDTELLETLSNPKKNSSEEILSKLIDRYGTGRLIYRNRKCNLAYFPKRNIFFEPLEPSSSYKKTIESLSPEDLDQRTLIDYATGRKPDSAESSVSSSEDKRVSWLADYIKRTSGKTFVICSSKARVLDVYQKLEKILDLPQEGTKELITLFHEGKSTIERDKEAAAFASPESKARVLIASELGGEGRNFQFLKNMILLDLPSTPETLEQRIGRLDRIGQGKSINIYIPYLKDSPEEVFIKWYHEGLKAFSSQNPSHGIILENLAEDILETLLYFFPKHKDFENKNEKLASLVKETKKEQEKINAELEKTQDVLLDLNSYNKEKTKKLIEKIDKHEDNPHLESFVLSALDFLGIDYEDYDKRGSIKINADSLSFVSDLPLFEEIQDKILTFDRSVFLSKYNSYFISFPSKFVQTLLEVTTNEDQGRFSFCSMTDSSQEKKVYFQALFSLQAKGPKALELEKYFPLETVEHLINSKGMKLEEVVDCGKLEPIKKDSPYSPMIKSQKFIDILTKNMGRLEQESFSWKEEILQKVSRKVSQAEKEKTSHLKYLTRVNPMYSEEDLEACHNKFKQIHTCVKEAKVSLEAIRVILLNP